MNKLTSLAALAVALALPAAAQSVRFPPIPADKMDAKTKAFADDLKNSPRAGNINNAPFKVYARSPEFATYAIKMSDYLRWGTGLDPKLSELAIIIAARNWTSDYIWHAHYPLAVKGGLDPKIGAAIAAGQKPTGMTPDEAIVYNFLTEIYRDKNVSDASFDAAVKRFGEKGVTDLIGLAGYYGITAMSLITAKADTAPGDEPKLARIAQVFPK